jgi:hypothetical protein
VEIETFMSEKTHLKGFDESLFDCRIYAADVGRNSPPIRQVLQDLRMQY